MIPETATATIPIEASSPSETPATLLTTVSKETDSTQQTQPAQTQTLTSAETPVTETKPLESSETPVVPENYTFTAPEGKQFDPQVLESFSGAAKEAGLTQDAAQKLVEKMAPALAARQADQVKAIQTEWFNASTADKEFGGEKLQENLGVARKALDTFGTPELRKLLNDTGLEKNPEIIRFMFRAGKAISEDKFVSGNSTGSGKLPASNVLYDKTKKG
ncbi:MAG: hypothetical protein WB424_07480 [Terracidiphilus sp.]